MAASYHSQTSTCAPCQKRPPSGRSLTPGSRSVAAESRLAASSSLPSLLSNRRRSKPSSMQAAREKEIANEPKQNPQSFDLACRQSSVTSRAMSKQQNYHADLSQSPSKLKLSDTSSPVSSSSPKAVNKATHRVDMATHAFMLARRYQLDLYEVNLVLKELQMVPCALPNGGIEVAKFKFFLQRVFGCQQVPDEISEEAYEECLAHDGPLDVDKFLLWYRNNMFASVASMTADRHMRRNDDIIASVARRHDISLIQAGRIKQEFCRFDADGSGEIDFPEFCQMMGRLMGTNTPGDIPPDRMQRFWKEIDFDGNGTVDFEEFTNWYMKYFPDEQSGGIQEAFYASYSPDVQRKRFLQEAQRVEQKLLTPAGSRGWSAWSVG